MQYGYTSSANYDTGAQVLYGGAFSLDSRVAYTGSFGLTKSYYEYYSQFFNNVSGYNGNFIVTLNLDVLELADFAPMMQNAPESEAFALIGLGLADLVVSCHRARQNPLALTNNSYCASSEASVACRLRRCKCSVLVDSRCRASCRLMTVYGIRYFW